ncbi:MAG: hypothetical protein AMJ54_10835 [Deltaproteobacteria bacterium SG8_13]|nr:MAG: hypothetical protein AMJ54_10835 [Deltaproteobacteria bacterium SG8_13]
MSARWFRKSHHIRFKAAVNQDVSRTDAHTLLEPIAAIAGPGPVKYHHRQDADRPDACRAGSNLLPEVNVLRESIPAVRPPFIGRTKQSGY